jgi:uncharacterized protein YecT (DUF1311 family)
MKPDGFFAFRGYNLIMATLLKKIASLAAVLLLSGFCFNGYAQSLKTIEELERKHQACLDSGINMFGCSKRFYFQMDSMLNIAYNALRSALPPEGKAALKEEQLAWLKKRDIYFKKQNASYRKNVKSGEWGPDMYMVVYDMDAEFVKERTINLFKRIK